MTSSKRILTTKFHEFCGHCSLNGLHYLSRDHAWPVRAVWATVVAASAGLCGFLGNMIWEKFALDPTFTVVETTHYPTSRLDFPAVTVCDQEMVYGPASENITNILENRGFTRYQIAAFYDSFTAIKKSYNPPPYVRSMHSVLRELGFSIADLLKMLRMPCEVLLAKCTWRSHQHRCSDMFRHVYTHNGYCCEFTMNYFKKHADKETNFISDVESTEALAIMVDGRKFSFDGNVTDGYVLLYVYDAQNSLSVADSPTTLTPSGYFDVKINSWVIDSSDDVKTLSLQSRRCLIQTDNIKTGRYYEECMSRLILSKAASTCRCLPFNYSAMQLNVENYSACAWERLICIHQTIAKVQANIRDVVSQNECLQRCDYVQYETDIEYVRYMRKISDLNQTLSYVAVHFATTTCMKYRREVHYTWDQVLANLGGIFGLCLGGSIISIIEVFWFVLDVLFTLSSKISRRSYRPRRNQARVFTLTAKKIKMKSVKEKKSVL